MENDAPTKKVIYCAQSCISGKYLPDIFNLLNNDLKIELQFEDDSQMAAHYATEGGADLIIVVTDGGFQRLNWVAKAIGDKSVCVPILVLYTDMGTLEPSLAPDLPKLCQGVTVASMDLCARPQDKVKLIRDILTGSPGRVLGGDLSALP